MSGGHCGSEPKRLKTVPGRVVACALALLALAAGSAAFADPSDSKPKAKASSFAPHHAGNHVYGAPIAKPIVHKQKKHAHAAAPPAATQPIK